MTSCSCLGCGFLSISTNAILLIVCIIARTRTFAILCVIGVASHCLSTSIKVRQIFVLHEICSAYYLLYFHSTLILKLNTSKTEN